MEIGNIIKKYRKLNSVSMDEFAKRSGLSKGYISMLESGKNPKTGKPIAPSLETYESIALAMNLPADMLIKMAGKAKSEVASELPANAIKAPRMVKKPLIGSIACGLPILAEENFEGEVAVPEYIKCDFALKAKGDSMIGARINDGDIVYIKMQPDVNNGQIAAVLVNDDEATLKRVRKVGDIVMLVPENPDYDAIILNGDVPAKIIGLAVGFTSVLV
ncbi:MAG: helix-turn-helix domain-containing protein [Clostridia bacterium]|nr:helix-turn-helix domain-containing protein [Clostridia bacterium]